MIPFGPVPSRRLGRSLGINNIPPKLCTYSCIYCQVGRTRGAVAHRRKLYDPDRVVGEVRERVEKLEDRGERIDYLTYVPDGEPTIDIHLGEEIERLGDLGVPVAVITNSSLIADQTVREDLSRADLVSLKIDTVDEQVWKRVNRPHPDLSLDRILGGVRQFAGSFSGTLLTETLLVSDVNDREDLVGRVADFLAPIRPARAYLSIPIRPPAESWVMPPPEERVLRAYQMFQEAGLETECLTGPEGTNFSGSGDPVEDLLAITAVHPMREDAVREFIRNTGRDFSLVRRLIEDGKLAEVRYRGIRYYLKRYSRSSQERRSEAGPGV